MEPDGKLGREDAGLFGGDGEGVRHEDGRMGKGGAESKSGPLGGGYRDVK